MSKAGKNKQIDADILQCKADILRARDIMPEPPPPYKKEETHQKPKSQNGSENTTHSADAVPKSAEEEKPAKSASKQQEKMEIPRFDLAEEIMAEQRKITAIRRKAPGKKIEAQPEWPQAKPVGYGIERSIPWEAEQDQIIAEIVTRDIEKLCRGDYLADSE
ncbi:hypothetical protein ES703_41305 [subsurface metagenome]